jgi:hypothetical protein
MTGGQNNVKQSNHGLVRDAMQDLPGVSDKNYGNIGQDSLTSFRESN